MDIIQEAREAFEACEEAESENRNLALDDLKFARMAEQWPEVVKRQREIEGRPCLTINRLPSFIRQVVNDARQNKPQIKVHPVDSGADRETADIMSGLIRNIEYTSSADIAYDTAIDFAASMGFGYFRIVMDYAYDDTFDMDLLIKRISNPFTVYGDPYATEADGCDWNVAFITEMLKKEEFLKKYPDADEVDWEADGKDENDWITKESIRIAEYWKRSEVEKNILMLSSGQIMDEAQFEENRDLFITSGLTVVQERPVKSYKTTQYILAGDQELEKNPWPGKYIPIVPVYGEEINIEGKRIFQSLIRQAKDAQRMFNYWRTASTELVALAPKAPYIGKKGAFKSDADKWSTANTVSHPYIEYDEGEMPQRQPFSGVPAGALQEALNASDDMKSIMGIHDASLGAKSNETSGKAIMARQREGDVSTFHFIDNMTRSIRHAGRILIDLIPHVYNKERVIRVMGEDTKPESVKINTEVPVMDENGQPMVDEQGQAITRIYDLTSGKYDLTVAAGPSFTSRREEAAVQMTEFIRSYPAAAPVIGDILARNLDWPGADEIEERLKALHEGQGKQQVDPKIVADQQRLKLDQEKAQADYKLSQDKMAMEAAQSQQNIKLKQEELAAEIQLKRDKILLDAILKREEMVAKAQAQEMTKEGHPYMEMSRNNSEATQQTTQALLKSLEGMTIALNGMTNTFSAPKELITDPQTGRKRVVTVQDTVN